MPAGTAGPADVRVAPSHVIKGIAEEQIIAGPGSNRSTMATTLSWLGERESYVL